jgi:two-component system chemotaxis response regulator CheB
MSTAASKKIRVLIVDDSPFMRKVLESIFNADENLQVIGQAKDGREAVALAASLKPDVITMDINMPHVDGLQATAQIMTENPRPIVVVSSESRDGAASTLRALELGAIEFVAKPSSGVDLDIRNVKDDLIRKVRMAAKVRVVRTASRTFNGKASSAESLASTAPKMLQANPPSKVNSVARPRNSGGQQFPIVVLGASTGGPATVMRLVTSIGRDFPAAILLIQHMPAAFTSQYAAQLAELAEIRVKEAARNDLLQTGTVFVCPGNQHLRIDSTGRIQLDGVSGRINGYLPNIDVTLESVAGYCGPLSIGVVLTGMGDDGAVGAKAIKRAGGYVIAQNEATSTVFGMPAEAIKTGAVDEVLGVDDIGKALENRVLALCAAPAGVK